MPGCSAGWYDDAQKQGNNGATSLSRRENAKRAHARVLKMHPLKAVLIYFGIYPWILTWFIQSWHRMQPWQTQFASLIPPQPSFLPWLPFHTPTPPLGVTHRWETGRPDRFDVFLRKKSAFHKHAVFANRADRRSVAVKYRRAHRGGGFVVEVGGATLVPDKLSFSKH